MLDAVDKGLAVITWIVATVLVVMLLVGPKVIADDKAKPPPAGQSPYAATSSTAAPDGKQLFKDNCGSCHTLSAAGTSGSIGPKLDGSGVDETTVKAFMKTGPGAMPTFTSLSPAETAAIAKFVAASSR